MTPHIEAEKEDIAKLVLMPGDPLRAKYIAQKYLKDYKLVNKVRNMYAYTGYYNGTKVTIFASGMGIPSIGIYAYELLKFYDVEKIIRIGTSGSSNKDIKVLDVVLSEGSYSKSYFPKLLDNNETNYVESNKELNDKIMENAKLNNIDIKYGKTITSDVFDLYADDIDVFRSNYPSDNYLAVEMEAFALFYLGKKFNKQTSCLMTVVDSLYDKRSLTSEEREKSLDNMITIALNSIIK